MLLPMAKLSGFVDFGWAVYTFPTKKRPGQNAFPPPKILVWRISKTAYYVLPSFALPTLALLRCTGATMISGFE